MLTVHENNYICDIQVAKRVLVIDFKDLVDFHFHMPLKICQF
jgi:hypothetical protein